jgi:3-oxoacyl-[acyl-carrier-protein] synthase II
MVDGGAVAITGLGLVLPHGVGLGAAEAVFEGRSAIRYLPPLAGLPEATGAAVSGFASPPGVESCDRAVQFAVTAADEAWARSGLAAGGFAADRVATVLSLSKGCMFSLADSADPRDDGWPAAFQATADVAARTVAARLGLTGPLGAPVTACASGGHALAWGATLIRRGVADAALVGAAEASLHPMILGSYRRLGVLAAPQGDPATSVRPFSATRRGFAIGEGAGVLVLESEASVRRRGVRPLAWVRGWARGCQTSGLMDMEPGGETLARLMGQAMDRAGVVPAAIDFVHAHGTGTRANDAAEALAIRSALGPAAEGVSVSSTKGAHGHLLGAAAAVELVLVVLAMERGLVPPTANLTDPDPQIRLDCTPLAPRRRDIRHALKITCGFGGQAMVAVLARP